MTPLDRPVSEKTALRIAQTLERIAAATETQVLLLKVLLDGNPNQQMPEIPAVLMTHTGPVVLG